MTCNRNCDCVGECKAGNDKPTTPTPGDLSARHVEVLQGVLEAAVCPMKEHGCDGTQYPVGDPQGDYHGEQCQWCHERTEAIAALAVFVNPADSPLAGALESGIRHCLSETAK